MSDTDRASDGVDALAGIDPWSALEDGRAQLLRALDGLTPADAARPLADAPGWSVADLLTHVSAWDELTARFLRALAAGARDLPVEAVRDGDWAAWNAAHLPAAASHP
ncbi:MAG: maleylpyruvate isomerase N-terminal domain-containing protein [Dehalococcoidia bacterium]